MRKPGLAWALVGLLCSSVAAGQSPAPRPDVTFQNEKGELQAGVRCGVPAVDAATAAQVDAEIRRASNRLEKAGKKLVPVAFHVLQSGKRGRVADAQIRSQIALLNAAFSGTGFEFYLASVDRTQSSRWFKSCNGAQEIAMKQRLAVDPARTLNIYTCQPLSGILGTAPLPWYYPEDSFRHGVILHFGTLPGGSSRPFHRGMTAVHETGHYLGLYHTFQKGCLDPGDGVADTPYESSPAYKCPVGRDSCPALPGTDPVQNYMDYSDDACLTHFTAEQAERMHASVATYRPSL